MYDQLKTLSQHFLQVKNAKYQRYFIKKNQLKHRLSIIIGQRGVGKTTTLIQYLLSEVKGDCFSSNILYIQADHFLMGKTSLYEIVEQFYSLGGTFIAFDEIHKYPNWSMELKSIYDTFPKLKIIASGSSLLEVYQGSHDLSRRAITYRMHNLSLREYIELNHSLVLPTFSLEEICRHHERFASQIIDILAKQNKKILPEFLNYLRVGCYPYFLEIGDEIIYQMTLEQNLHSTIESDMATAYPHLTGASLQKIKQLLMYIAGSVPFTPNWQKIREIIGVADPRTAKAYFHHLEEAGLIQTIGKSGKKMSAIGSSEKIYLNNTNQIYAISSEKSNLGTIRETFFLNAVSESHSLILPGVGDFLVDDFYLFEIGGKKKSFEQIKSEKNGYLACDEIECGSGARIPLWLFGFLF